MNEPIAAFDIGRMLFGDEPPLFLLEIAVRTVIIYVYTLFLIRWIGSRSIAQLSLVEFLLVIALGSAVGDGMFYPDVPLVHCMIVIAVVILLDKALSHLLARHPKFEDMIEGLSVQVIRDGIIDVKTLKKIQFGHDELFEQLRLKDVSNLNEVRAAYLETNGMVSVFKFDDPDHEAGLSIEPPWDVRSPVEIRAGDPFNGTIACPDCATVLKTSGEATPRCPRCDSKVWHQAAAD
ncbi:MAG: DUF421 domain-containing protein [Rhizobiaceae bacterium]|nr:DUF421 domain-containing protein [Rhizobiaceae bacterium]